MIADDFDINNADEPRLSAEALFGETECEYSYKIEELDPVEFVRINEAYCFNQEHFATKYVDAILECATQELTERPKSYRVTDIVSPIVDYMVSSALAEGIESEALESEKPLQGAKTFKGWPKISEFNIKLGLERLEEYIDTWERGPEWMCCVEFLGFESEETSNYFVYEVEFSQPTPAYPIPQATASVYFSLEVSKIVPPQYDRPIDVSYVFETNTSIHRPGQIKFQECWIRDILTCKTNFFKTVTF